MLLCLLLLLSHCSAVCSLHLHSATSYIYSEWRKKQGRRRIRTCYVALKYLFTLLLLFVYIWNLFISKHEYFLTLSFLHNSHRAIWFLLLSYIFLLLLTPPRCTWEKSVSEEQISSAPRYLHHTRMLAYFAFRGIFSTAKRRSVWRMFVWFMHTWRYCWLRDDDDLSSNSGALSDDFGSVQDDEVKLLEKSLENCLFFTCEGAQRWRDR